MIPRINPRGQSFKGVTSYLLYGEDRTETPERVAWSMTGNLYTNDLEKAAKVMAFTAINAEDIKRSNGGSLAGAKAEGKPVYHQSLSWRTGDEPSREHMQKTALDYIENQGLSDHEYYIAAHNDTDHKHLHIVVNLVHPQTGIIHKQGLDKTQAQAWALEYSQEHEQGKNYCPKRAENAALRAQGQGLKHQDQKQDYSEKVTRAYYAADNGKAFINSLQAEGLELAQGRRGGFVIVDETGDIQRLGRQLEIDESGKKKTAAIKAKLGDIGAVDLQDADILAAKIREEIDREKEKKESEEQKEKGQENQAQEDAQQQLEESQNIDQEKQNRQEEFNKNAEAGRLAADYNRAGDRGGIHAASQKEIGQSFNQESGAEITQTNGQQPDKQNTYYGRTAEEIAAEFVELAGEPLQDLRGWLDETEQGQSNNSLPSGQAGSAADDYALRQVRDEEATEGGNTGDIDQGQPQHFDRDRYEAEQQNQIEKAAILSPDLEKLYIPRFAKLKAIKGENAALREEQQIEKTALIARLKANETEAEKNHRERWQEVINAEREEQGSIEKEIRAKGILAAINRFRYGDELREQHGAHGQNIDNARMRLEEGINQLSRGDKRAIVALNKKHFEQREDLRQEQKQDLQAIEDSRAEQEEKLIAQAQISPQLAQSLINSATPENVRARKQAAELAEIARRHKEQESENLHQPDDGRREHEQKTEPEQSPIIEQERRGWFDREQDQNQEQDNGLDND